MLSFRLLKVLRQKRRIALEAVAITKLQGQYQYRWNRMSQLGHISDLSPGSRQNDARSLTPNFLGNAIWIVNAGATNHKY